MSTLIKSVLTTVDKSSLLVKIAENLDISESNYQKAIARYESLGKWLERKESSVAKYKPQVSGQGSIVLGTVTKPVSDQEEYDLDAICLLEILRSDITQQQLKILIGAELKEYTRSNQMKSAPEEKRRCWRLEYADEAKFHMDILPAIPGDDWMQRKFADLGVNVNWAKTGIFITDNKHDTFSTISDDWPHSNPKGYALWFRFQMESQFNEKRKAIANSQFKAVEAIPEYKVKTPLQYGIQLLKRHRDIMFINDSDNKPISIIITTLAAHVYNNESDMLFALMGIINEMEKYIEIRNGEYWVQNPVDPNENFADKWNENLKLKDNFYKWIKQLKSDFAKIIAMSDSDELSRFLKPILGEKAINSVSSEISATQKTPTTPKEKIYTNVVIPAAVSPKPWGSDV